MIVIIEQLKTLRARLGRRRQGANMLYSDYQETKEGEEAMSVELLQYRAALLALLARLRYQPPPRADLGNHQGPNGRAQWQCLRARALALTSTCGPVAPPNRL